MATIIGANDEDFLFFETNRNDTIRGRDGNDRCSMRVWAGLVLLSRTFVRRKCFGT